MYYLNLFFIVTLLFFLLYNFVKLNHENFKINIDKVGMNRYIFNGYYNQDLDFFNNNSNLINVKLITKINIPKKIRNLSYLFETEYIPTESGFYSFKTISTGSSYVYIDDVKVVDNGGIHSLREKEGNIYLISGEIYKLKVYYSNNIGKSILRFLWKTPDDYFYKEVLDYFIPKLLDHE